VPSTSPESTDTSSAPADESGARRSDGAAAPADSRASSGTSAIPRRSHDITVFGATGFTGSLVAKYLARKAPSDVRIALAGRNSEKLAEVRRSLGGHATDWPMIIADSADAASLARMAADSRAVVTTVGPFSAHGLGLVGACAAAGTHYADITGEVLFMRESIDRFDAAARASGARIVHSCGFDSIPSDLGVLMLHVAAKHHDGVGHLDQTHLIVRRMKGGFSGGTARSGLAEVEAGAKDPAAAKILADPYSLSPDRSREPQAAPSGWGVRHDDVVGVWVAPFLMADINTRVVRRSNALSDYAYGHGFTYDESMSTGAGPRGRLSAMAMAGALSVGRIATRVEPVRGLLGHVLPESGEGPSEHARENGMFDIVVYGRTPQRVLFRAVVAADGDPGYAATSLMLSTSGLTLVRDADSLPSGGGVWTPATGMGLTLVNNLKRAGMTLTAARV
jgi:short subunit dehydrogenase-like uncharacterized protein